MSFLKKFALKYLPVSRRRHTQELNQLRSKLIKLHEHELAKVHRDLDNLIPKLVSLSLECYDNARSHRLQILLNEHMMQELNYSQNKEYISKAIGRMVEHEISRLHYVFPTR